MSETKKTTKKRIIDVAHPGETPPPSSSKPVIVTNRPILKDPMVVVENDKPTAPPLTSSAEMKVTPIEVAGDTVKAESSGEDKAKKGKTIAELAEEAQVRASKKAEPDVKDEVVLKPAADEASQETPAPKEPKEETKEEKKSEEADEPTSEPVANAKTPPKDDETLAAEHAKRDEELQNLVDSKQYFLSINAVEKRRTKRVVIIGIVVSILLAVAWVDIALDAGLLQINGIKPVTHLFSN